MSYSDLFQDFLSGKDTLRVYRDETLVFSSQKDRLLPLMDYTANHGRSEKPVVVFDKIMGNAAALLVSRLNCREVYSPLGSELAIKTLEKFGIKYHLDETVPYVCRPDGYRMCPMEELSLDKTPEEFYKEMKNRIEANR
jgi:Domain of unknown function (DUF1893)